MKILVLNYEFPPVGGGGGTASEDIAVTYAKLGHSVTVLTMGFQELPVSESKNDIEIIRLDCGRKKASSCSPIEQYRYIKEVEKYFFEHKEIQKCDICHVHFVVPTGEAAYRIRKKYDIPYIITAHGSDVDGYSSKIVVRIMHKILKYRWRTIVKNAGCVVSPSQYLLGLIRHNYVDGNYNIIPNGIDSKEYNKIESINRQKKILIMGRLQEHKNVQFVLTAYAKLNIPDWKVEVVGDGPYRDTLESLAKEMNISGQVQFHGWIKHNDEFMKKLLSESAIYISASKYENCPMSVIEAATAGCYPLVSDILAHREILPAEYLFELDNDDCLRRKLLERAKKYREPFEVDTSKYDLSKVADQYIGILGNVMHDKHRT